MAKVIVTIEDQLGPDGKTGLTIAWESSEPKDEKSLANNWAAYAINQIVAQGESVTDLTDTKPTENEGMN